MAGWGGKINLFYEYSNSLWNWNNDTHRRNKKNSARARRQSRRDNAMKCVSYTFPLTLIKYMYEIQTNARIAETTVRERFNSRKWKWMTAERATNLFMIQWQEISIPTTMLFTRPTLYLVALSLSLPKIQIYTPKIFIIQTERWKMKYIFQLVRLERAPWDSLDVCRHSWANSSSSNSLVFLSSLRQRIRLKFPKLVGEQMTKVPNELKFFSLLCNAISPIVLKSSSHFIIASHAQQSSSTVSLHLERWMHSNLKLFIGCFVKIPLYSICSSDMTLYNSAEEKKSAQMKCVNFQWTFRVLQQLRPNSISNWDQARAREHFQNIKMEQTSCLFYVFFEAVERVHRVCKLNICWKNRVEKKSSINILLCH